MSTNLRNLRSKTPCPISGDNFYKGKTSNFSMDHVRRGVFDAVSLYRHHFKILTDDTIELVRSYRSQMDSLLTKNVSDLAPFLNQPRAIDSSEMLHPDTLELMVNFYHIFSSTHLELRKQLSVAIEKATDFILSRKISDGEPKSIELPINLSGLHVKTQMHRYHLRNQQISSFHSHRCFGSLQFD